MKIIPRAEWTAGLEPRGGHPPAWRSDDGPRAAIRLPVAMLMVHYAGSPDSKGSYLSADPLRYMRGMYAWSFGPGVRGDEYNWVIAGRDGMVYEWAGDHVGAHCSNWNASSIGVQLGLDVNDVPPDIYADRLLELRRHLVAAGVLTAGHHVDQHGQHFPTGCPGEHVKARWDEYDRPLEPPPEPPEEDDMPTPMLLAVTSHPGYDPRTQVVYLADGRYMTVRWVRSEDELADLRAEFIALGWNATPRALDFTELGTYGVVVGPAP